MRTALALAFFLTLIFSGPQALASDNHCQAFLENIKTIFAQGIEQIEKDSPHRAYDLFGEVLIRFNVEKKYLKSCTSSQDSKLKELKEKSAQTLTSLSERIFKEKNLTYSSF